MAESGSHASTGIAGALTLSAIIHVTLLSAGGFASRTYSPGASVALQVRLAPIQPARPEPMPAQQQPAPDRLSAPSKARRHQAPARPEPAVDPLPVTDAAAQGSSIERAPRAQTPFTLATFDPSRYLTFRQVDRGMVPTDPDWLDRIPFSGTGPGEWLVRLFVNEEGTVDEVEVLESRGSQVNTDELRAHLAAARFEPARRGAEPVKSQTMLEVRFQSPTAGPDLFRPSLVPSATGK